MIFGHQDGQDGATDDQQPSGAPLAGSFIVGAQPDDSQAATSAALPTSDSSDDSQAMTVQPVQADAVSLSDETGFGMSESIMQPDEPEDNVQPPAVQTTDDTTTDDDTDSATVSVPNADLLVLKQQALSDLGPLVSQLDQTPEERFRTTMMMLQSTDNQALIKDAYTAAQAIEDEKTRAQALLDVINEINYFTQQSGKE